ncbi:MAG: PQQ-like beta-propeller repeat protein [Planctomycetota bacterium]|nr:PQQ-like beta-propeller repeat protein [Planctomycetota bacterium]
MNRMNHLKTSVRSLLGLFLATLCLAFWTAPSWPRWGGPRGDETWRGPRLPATWPKSGLKRVWHRELGGGYGGVAVVEGRVYVMDRQTEPVERERLVCRDAETGADIWIHEYPVEYGKLDYGNGPRGTPTIADGRVYTLGALGGLACVDAKTGKSVWHHDLKATHGARIPAWGLAASPLLWNELVIVHPGGAEGACLIAFDRLTGAERWRSGDDPAGYATPTVVESPAGPQLICWSPENILGVDPATGKLNWKIPYKVTYGVSIATPIYHENLVFVSGYWEGSKTVRLGKNATFAELAWEENKFLRGLMAQPIYRDKHVYTIDKQFGLTCFELSTGKKLWDCGNTVVERGRNPQATLTWIGDEDRALILNENGDLILARLNPKSYQEQGRTHIIDRKENSPIWAHPAYAGKRVYARSDTELVCVELPAER